MSILDLGPCEITGIFGPMASGKTFLINHWLKTQNRFVQFDVTGETINKDGIEHVWSSPSQLYSAMRNSPYYFRIAYHPGRFLDEEFYLALRCVWRIPTYKLLVCDEFHEVCSVNSTPDYVSTMIRYARHNHLAVIGASQRIADVSKLFTSGCRKIVLFWTQEARDLQAIADRWGSETREMVRSLTPLVYNDVEGTVSQVPQCVVCQKSAKPEVVELDLRL